MSTNKSESFIIQGLGGKKSLKGTVAVNGAKNATLKAMAAAILFDGPVTLKNVPDNSDIHTLAEIMGNLGAKVDFKNVGGNSQTATADSPTSSGLTLSIDASSLTSTDIHDGLARIMRASIVLTGPLLSRFGKVTFPAPGGCVIGARPIDIFLDGYQKMGATVNETESTYTIKVDTDSNSSALYGTRIDFKKITVGGTETLMMAAVLANGTTTLTNCALEPEIVNVAEWLNECGANIKGAGTPTITITGSSGQLLKPKTPYIAIPDRIEAGSYLLLGALCANELTIRNCQPKHLETLIGLLKGSGVPIEIGGDFIKITGNTQPNSSFKSFDVNTKEYPGLATDLQAQAVVYLTQVTGESTVTENIFEGRFKYVQDLLNLGANIETVNERKLKITGPTKLNHPTKESGTLGAHDIRAGFAIVMAALVAEGEFEIKNVHLINRGYEKLEERLRVLGCNIRRS